MTDVRKRSPRVLRGSNAGFSLLELLLVLFIMGLMTATAMLMTGGVEDQSKYDETKRRMELIKRAIVGDPTRTVNGGPEISGFVADMGRLPANLQELLELGTQSAWTTATSSVGVAVSGVGEVSPQLQGGWRGPYVDVVPDSGGARVLRDGYGFNFSVLPSPTTWRMKSKGADGVADNADDYPVSAVLGTSDADLLVRQDDFEVGVGGAILSVDFGQPPAANETLRLRIYFMENAAMTNVEGDFPASISGVSAHPVTFAAGETLPFGRLAAVVLCSNGHVYDGNCSGNTLHTTPFYFTLVPRSQLPLIRWDIQ